jgi:hypothetical protein
VRIFVVALDSPPNPTILTPSTPAFAWLDEQTIQTPSGLVYPVGPASRFMDTLKRDNANQPAVYEKGLGTFRVGRYPWDETGKHLHWVYIAPSGIEYDTNWFLSRCPEPPPLPRPQAEWRQARCCDGPHICSECGQPYFIEIHGVADGFCTYCYHHG